MQPTSTKARAVTMPSPKTVLSDFDIHRMRRPTQTRTARSILEATDGGSLSAYDVVAEVDGAQHLEVSDLVG